MVEGRGRRAAAPLIVLALLALGADTASAASALGASQLANRCVALETGGGRTLERFYLKPTKVGSHMFYDRRRELLGVNEDGELERGTAPGPATEWLFVRVGPRRFGPRAAESGRLLAADGRTLATATKPSLRTVFRFRRARGCPRYPELAPGAKGTIFRGRIGRNVFGYTDAHLHVVADLRAGGRVISGESFNRFGVTEALGNDAEVHGPNGSFDIAGQLLRGESGGHDTEGWPSFAGWPTYDTYTHQQTYYQWLRRAYMGGLRVVVAQLIEDAPLCRLMESSPSGTSHSCDETETIALEAQRLRELQAYVDAQSGGRGRGWFRIVTSARQARRVIERGKLAVVMGVESSSPFGCTEFMGQPECDRDDVDRGIALYRRLGIRSMFVAHWVNNAFAGASVEEGDIGTFIASFNVEETGRPFETGECPHPDYGEECNTKGLTELGEYLIDRLMDNHMLIEVDHLSERARLRVLEIAKERDYPLVSSHTGSGGFWREDDLKNLFDAGGFATARPDTAKKLAARILELARQAPDDAPVPVGLGTDTGGFAATVEPDPGAEQRPLAYPFKSYDGRVTFVCAVAGERRFDLNREGVATYGQYPDLLAAMRQQTGGKRASRLLFSSAEAYLRTWRRAEG